MESPQSSGYVFGQTGTFTSPPPKSPWLFKMTNHISPISPSLTPGNKSGEGIECLETSYDADNKKEAFISPRKLDSGATHSFNQNSISLSGNTFDLTFASKSIEPVESSQNKSAFTRIEREAEDTQTCQDYVVSPDPLDHSNKVSGSSEISISTRERLQMHANIVSLDQRGESLGSINSFSSSDERSLRLDNSISIDSSIIGTKSAGKNKKVYMKNSQNSAISPHDKNFNTSSNPLPMISIFRPLGSFSSSVTFFHTNSNEKSTKLEEENDTDSKADSSNGLEKNSCVTKKEGTLESTSCSTREVEETNEKKKEDTLALDQLQAIMIENINSLPLRKRPFQNESVDTKQGEDKKRIICESFASNDESNMLEHVCKPPQDSKDNIEQTQSHVKGRAVCRKLSLDPLHHHLLVATRNSSINNTNKSNRSLLCKLPSCTSFNKLTTMQKTKQSNVLPSSIPHPSFLPPDPLELSLTTYGKSDKNPLHQKRPFGSVTTPFSVQSFDKKISLVNSMPIKFDDTMVAISEDRSFDRERNNARKYNSQHLFVSKQKNLTNTTLLPNIAKIIPEFSATLESSEKLTTIQSSYGVSDNSKQFKANNVLHMDSDSWKPPKIAPQPGSLNSIKFLENSDQFFNIDEKNLSNLNYTAKIQGEHTCNSPDSLHMLKVKDALVAIFVERVSMDTELVSKLSIEQIEFLIGLPTDKIAAFLKHFDQCKSKNTPVKWGLIETMISQGNVSDQDLLYLDEDKKS